MTAPTPDLPTADAPAPDPQVPHAVVADPARDAVRDEEPATAPGVATGAAAEDLGLFAPTWYVVLCALPFAAAFLVPMLLIYQGQNAVPPLTATEAAWHGVGAGWLLWALGTVFWLLGKVVLSTPRSHAPHAWAWWDRTTRAWMLVVLLWGLVASLAVLLAGLMIDRLAA